MILYITLVIVFYYILKLVVLPYFKYLKYRKYGRGQFTPLIGELVQFQESMTKYNDVDYVFNHQCDDDPEQKIYVVNLGTRAKIRIFDPDLIKEFFLNQQHYVKDTLFIGNAMRVAPQGIAFTEGQLWKKSRKLFSQAFHYEYLLSLAPMIDKIVQNVFDSAIKNTNIERFDPLVHMQEITGTVIIASFFGETLENQTFRGMNLIQALTQLLNHLGEQTITPQYFIFGPKFFQLGLTKSHRYVETFIQQFNQFIKNQIEKKIYQIQSEIKATGKTTNPSILAQIVQTEQIDQESEKYLLDDFKTFYSAGMDTTGHLLALTIYYITQDQSLYKSLQQEIDNNQDESPHGLSQLPYLNAVIKETLRYYGPANVLFDRIAIEDHTLGGIPIKKGTIVTPYAVCMQRNSKYYEDPHTYNPKRWLDKNSSQLHPYAFIPFSAGQRNCIGQHLAMLESRITIYKFFKMFEFSCPPDYKLVMTQRFMSEPKDPIPIKLIQRNKNYN